jgi:glyceraldehyde 3-phosphate dehydrogenase
VGRCALRSAYEHDADIEVIAINDLVEPATLAHLLQYDSVFGRFPGKVEVENGGLNIAGMDVRAFAETDPSSLPWDELGVDVVIESTGRFRTRAGAEKHLAAGARKVIISAPTKGDQPPDATVVLGVNFDEVYDEDRHEIISNASCTTNCLAPVAKVLHETVGIRHGLMTTVHAYTPDQHLLDGPHSDLRRARAAALNIIPTSTGAAKALGLVIPELAGRLNGFAVRVPTPTGSLVDLTVETERPTSKEQINAAFAAAASEDPLRGILDYTEDPIVSSDIVKSPYSSIFDASLTSVIDGTQVKVISWYDNEWGYSTRLVELAEKVGAPIARAV